MDTKLNPRILGLFLIIVGVTTLSLYQTRPPAAVPASAPETEFSAERAMRHVAAISQEPHATGSPEIYKVRDYILGELSDLGLNPETQVSVTQNPFREDEVALTESVVAKIPGADSTRAILLVGHYDTVPNSPGAADDGAAVATMLETGRALTAGPSLDNDVILLFSDAEENTFAGAQAFMDGHPWMSKVGLVLNFEMRGSSGPVYMFETGPENGRIIPEFARAVPYPATSSLMGVVYNNMPNKTDFSAFRDAGYAGFSFSVLEQVTNYHQPLDTAQKLNPRSLQHHGTYALGIARHFGNLDLGNLQAKDAVYFDLLGTTLIHYPGFWAIPSAIVVLLFFIGVVILGLRRRNVTLGGSGLGFLAFLAVLASGPGAVTTLWFLIRATVKPPVLNGDTYNSPLYFLGFGLLIVAITAALYNVFRRKLSGSNLAIGALLWWVILMLVVTAVFPTANFLFVWPLLFALIGAAYLILRDQEPLTWTSVVILAVAALPGLLLLPPVTYAIAQGLLQLLSLAGASLALVSLLLGLLVPHLMLMTKSHSRPGRWWLSAGFALGGTAVLIAAMVALRVDANHPRLVHLIYGLDTHTGEAIWAGLDSYEYYQGWRMQFISEQAPSGPLPQFFGSSRRRYTFEQAPVLAVSLPEITVLENAQEGDVRRLRLAIASTRGATQANFYIEPPAEVLSVTINGKTMAVAENPPDRKKMWNLHYFGPLKNGIELALKVRSAQPVRMLVVERAAGLPESPGQSIAPLLDHLIPFGDMDHPSHVTLVSSSFIFD